MQALEDLCKRWGIQPDNRGKYSNVRIRLRDAVVKGQIVDPRPANGKNWMWAEDDPQLPIVRALAERSGLVVGFTELEEILSSPSPAPAAAPAAAPAPSGGKRKAADDSPTAPVKHKAAKSKQASPKITYDPRRCGRDQLKSSIRAIFDALSHDEYQAGLVSARSVREQLEGDAKLEAGSLKPRKKLIGTLIDELINEDVFDRFSDLPGIDA